MPLPNPVFTEHPGTPAYATITMTPNLEVVMYLGRDDDPNAHGQLDELLGKLEWFELYPENHGEMRKASPRGRIDRAHMERNPAAAWWAPPEGSGLRKLTRMFRKNGDTPRKAQIVAQAYQRDLFRLRTSGDLKHFTVVVLVEICGEIVDGSQQYLTGVMLDSLGAPSNVYAELLTDTADLHGMVSEALEAAFPVANADTARRIQAVRDLACHLETAGR